MFKLELCLIPWHGTNKNGSGGSREGFFGIGSCLAALQQRQRTVFEL